MSDHDSTYAPKLTTLLRRKGGAGRVFIDGGACHGEFSNLLMTEFPDAKIHAFEPNAALCGSIEDRFRNNVQFKLWNKALWESSTDIELRVHVDPGTSSIFPRQSATRRYFHSSDSVVGSVIVRATSLDDFMADQEIGGVQLLKLDTQGSELSILRGAKNALKSQAVDVIYTEFFVAPHYESAPLLLDIWHYLADFGYSIFDLFKGPNAKNGQLRFGDAIFVSSSYRQRFLDTVTPED